MSTPYIGEIRMFGFGRTPNGWQACDGSLLPISQYDALFALINVRRRWWGRHSYPTSAAVSRSIRVKDRD